MFKEIFHGRTKTKQAKNLANEALARLDDLERRVAAIEDRHTEIDDLLGAGVGTYARGTVQVVFDSDGHVRKRRGRRRDTDAAAESDGDAE